MKEAAASMVKSFVFIFCVWSLMVCWLFMANPRYLTENSFPGAAYCMPLLYVDMAHVKNTFYADVFLAYIFQPA